VHARAAGRLPDPDRVCGAGDELSAVGTVHGMVDLGAVGAGESMPGSLGVSRALAGGALPGLASPGRSCALARTAASVPRDLWRRVRGVGAQQDDPEVEQLGRHRRRRRGPDLGGDL